MPTPKTCPYYIVRNEEELQSVRKAFDDYSMPALYDFPFIVGKEPDFVFQQADVENPLPMYKGKAGEPDLIYELRDIEQLKTRT